MPDRVLRKRISEAETAIVTLALHDRGTRIGCELWRASGLILKTKYFERPLLLTTATALPDTYHAVHATVYFKSPSDASSEDKPFTTTIAPNQYFVSSATTTVVEHFTKDERTSTILANYTLCALSDVLPEYVTPFILENIPIFSPGASILSWGTSVMRGVVKTVHGGIIEFAPDPTVDETLPNGTPVFLVESDLKKLCLIGLHIEHTYDSNNEQADDGTLNLNFLSRGEWRHHLISMDIISRHLEYSTNALQLMKGEERAKLETYLGKSNMRRDRINASLEVLEEIIEYPSKPPPEIFSSEDAELLATQAQGKGHEAVLTLMRVYRDDDVQFHCLEALFKLLTNGKQKCAQDVAKAGGCELVALALQRNLHKPELVCAAAKCISLMGERRDISLRFLRCDISTTLISGLRLASEHGAFHVEAQRWGLSAMTVLARNGLHKERMVSGGMCNIIPGLLSNHPDVINNIDLQINGLCCILELCQDSMDTAGNTILDAGLMAALRKVRTGSIGRNKEWKELAQVVLANLDWEG